MKLAKKLKKTMGLMLISTMVLSAVPTMAADYDNHWAKEAIIEWMGYGVVTGYDEDVFKPDHEVKRSELAAFIVRVFGLESTKDAAKFTDVAANAWYAQDVAKVSAAGIMQGASGQFNPNGFATREEVAVTLVNAFHLTGSGEMNFKDQDQIAAWAKEAVAALASSGYTKGQADNRFAPKSNITRAEVVQLLDNIVKELVHKPDTYTNNITGNVVVNTKDAVLESSKVNGNIYLAQGIGLGDATLKNTEVTGQVFVAGGGVNSIHFEKSVVTGGVVVDTEAPVRLVAKDSAISVAVEANQNLVLTGNFKEVVVPADVVLELKGATVEKITVEAGNQAIAQFIIDKTSEVKVLDVQAATQIQGDGKIAHLIVEANDVTTSITPDKMDVEEGINQPVYTDQAKEPVKDAPKNESNQENSQDSEKPSVQERIKIKSIALNDSYEMSSSMLSINGENVILNFNQGSSTGLPDSIEKATITFDNLKQGEVIKTVVDFPVLGEKEVTATVEAGGKVSYEMADLKEQLDAKKEALIQTLVNQKLDKVIEALLNQIGLSLEEDYLQNGSLDTNKAIAKIQQIFVYIENNQDKEEFKGFVEKLQEKLEAHHITIDKDNVSVKGTLDLKVEGKLDTQYTVTVNY